MAAFFGAYIVSVYTRLCENHDIEENTMMGLPIVELSYRRSCFESAGFAMNRLIDKENLGRSFCTRHEMGLGREKKAFWNSVSLIHTCCYPVYTYPIHDQTN